MENCTASELTPSLPSSSSSSSSGDFHVYDVVRATHEEPRPDIRIILTKYVEGYGDIGDAITVPSSDAREYLIPAQLALYDTPENRERVIGHKRLMDQ